jgi:hypothetical protein
MRLLVLLLIFCVQFAAALVTRETAFEFMHDWTIQCLLDGINKCQLCGWKAEIQYPEVKDLMSFHAGFPAVCQPLMSAMTPAMIEELRASFQMNT